MARRAAPRAARPRPAPRGSPVARVLEQPAHEVRHPGDEVADRAVRAHAVAAGDQRALQVVAEPAQDLELEIGRSPPPSARLTAIACATERRLCEAIATRTRRARLEQPARQRLEVAVAVGLVLEHRRAQPCWRASTISWSQ